MKYRRPCLVCGSNVRGSSCGSRRAGRDSEEPFLFSEQRKRNRKVGRGEVDGERIFLRAQKVGEEVDLWDKSGAEKR